MKSETDFTSRKKYLEYLRDYYTGLAMRAVIAKNPVCGQKHSPTKCPKLKPIIAASVAYADALIAELYPNEN